MTEKLKRGAVIAQAAAGTYAWVLDIGYSPVAAQAMQSIAENAVSKALDLTGYTDEEVPALRNRERPQTQDEAPAPRFVKLHLAKSGTGVYINAARIDMMMVEDNRTAVFTVGEDEPIRVRESVPEILEVMGAVQP